jgi:hypothetical protein
MICHPNTFALVCVPLRLAMAIGVSIAPIHHLRLWAIAGAICALGFVFLSVGTVNRDRGIETCGGPIWWKPMRPVHAALYAASATLAWHGHARFAGACLLADVFLGVAFREKVHKRLG